VPISPTSPRPRHNWLNSKSIRVSPGTATRNARAKRITPRSTALISCRTIMCAWREQEKCNSPQCVDLAFYFSLSFHATCHPGQDPPLWRPSTAILSHAFYFVENQGCFTIFGGLFCLARSFNASHLVNIDPGGYADGHVSIYRTFCVSKVRRIDSRSLPPATRLSMGEERNYPDLAPVEK
jgi:hypothetical protein